eukprot:TRINITY_DN993_c0_g1_i2.p1 TRINITY_DN993_c0_g1~~TRINITY_DN993_c0_g1_i2.p1  ORF type:complete len:548 (-),score=128.51 TRINITY_DN993_c0_g1_i2:667-2286(-)
MGRNKIAIERIANERSRQSTFTKRKNGLVKKAMELSILCDCDIAMLVFGPTGKLSTYASSDLHNMLTRFATHPEANNKPLNNEDYAAIARHETPSTTSFTSSDQAPLELSPRATRLGSSPSSTSKRKKRTPGDSDDSDSSYDDDTAARLLTPGGRSKRPASTSGVQHQHRPRSSRSRDGNHDNNETIEPIDAIDTDAVMALATATATATATARSSVGITQQVAPLALTSSINLSVPHQISRPTPLSSQPAAPAHSSASAAANAALALENAHRSHITITVTDPSNHTSNTNNAASNARTIFPPVPPQIPSSLTTVVVAESTPPPVPPVSPTVVQVNGELQNPMASPASNPFQFFGNNFPGIFSPSTGPTMQQENTPNEAMQISPRTTQNGQVFNKTFLANGAQLSPSNSFFTQQSSGMMQLFGPNTPNSLQSLPDDSPTINSITAQSSQNEIQSAESLQEMAAKAKNKRQLSVLIPGPNQLQVNVTSDPATEVTTDQKSSQYSHSDLPSRTGSTMSSCLDFIASPTCEHKVTDPSFTPKM